jgi:hypothetical protein
VRLAFALLLAGCGGSAPATFIALDSSFADYVSWGAIYLGTAENSGHPIGDEYGYRSEMPKSGAYPVGSILVKEIQAGSDPTMWDLFGMAKRGSDGEGGVYNRGGAEGWEFFTLTLDANRVPLIKSRGSNPIDTDGIGHGYGQAENGVTCNRCHGVPGTEASDHVLSAGLHPSP